MRFSLLVLSLLLPTAAFADADAVAAKVRELMDAYDNPVLGELLRQERSHGAPIAAAKVPNNSDAVYDAKAEKVLLNSDLIDINDKALIACGMGEDRRTWMLAVQLLPTVAHEQRHAYVKWRLAEDVGGWLPSTIEEEVVGFTNTVDVYEKLRLSDLFKDAFTQPCATTYNAAFYKIHRTAWQDASDGVDGLTGFLNGSSYYSKMCSLRKSEDVSACRRAAEANLASAKPEERDEAQKIAGFWGDDSRIAKARKYFESVEFVRTRRIFAARKALP